MSVAAAEATGGVTTVPVQVLDRALLWQRAAMSVALVAVLGGAAAGASLDHGNPPALTATLIGGFGSGARSDQTMGYLLPLVNPGPAATVLSVAVAGSGAPRLVGARAARGADCAGILAPVPAVWRHCAGADLGPLAGFRVPAGANPWRPWAWLRHPSQDVAAVLEVAAPRPGRCWWLHSMTLRYRVGFGVQASTSPVDAQVCTGRPPEPP